MLPIMVLSAEAILLTVLIIWLRVKSRRLDKEIHRQLEAMRKRVAVSNDSD